MNFNFYIKLRAHYYTYITFFHFLSKVIEQLKLQKIFQIIIKIRIEII